MCWMEYGVTQDFEGAWVHLQSVHFREYCNAYNERVAAQDNMLYTECKLDYELFTMQRGTCIKRLFWPPYEVKK